MTSVQITFRISAFHPAIIRALTELGASAVAVASEVNAELVAHTVDSSEKNSDRENEKTGKIVLKSSVKAAIESPKATPGLRLFRIHRYLNESANLYLEITNVVLPASIQTWAKATRFALSEKPVNA
jgi:hypothetical protein